MLIDPGMVQSHVVRHKVQQQLQTSLFQSASQTEQRGIAPERLGYLVAGDGKTGAGDILLAEVGQGLFEFSAPVGPASRYRSTGFPRLPHAQQPHPVEPQLG
jgi:hypothetical protein